MPNILALDTSSDNCSTVVLSDQALYRRCEKAPRSHTQLVLPMVKDCLSNASLSAKDLDAIAFGCGPGSFTGIRIAAGIAQGLAYGSDCPIYAISNIRAMALQSYLEKKIPYVLVAIDARMDEVYWACCHVIEVETDEGDTFYCVETFGEELVTKPEDVCLPNIVFNESVTGVGSGFDYHDRFSASVMERLDGVDAGLRPESDTICELARYAVYQGLAGKLEDALPSYVRNTVTWKKLPGRE